MSGLQQPIMQAHDPNDDPFGDLAPADNSGLVSPMEFGTGAVDPAKDTPPAAAAAPPVAETTNGEKKEDGGK
jgi:hypothetical protein